MTLAELLKTIEDINRNIRENNPSLRRRTIYEESGVLGASGRAMPVDVFMERYRGKKLDNKVDYLLRLIDPAYREAVTKNYITALVQTAVDMGADKQLINDLENQSFEEFERNYYAGEYDNIILRYEEIVDSRVTEAVEKANKGKTTTVDIHKLGGDELPY